MVLLPSFLLVLACLSGSFSQKDLHKKVFVFPTTSNTAVVVLNADLQQSVSKITVCLKYLSLLTRAYSLFSYATKSTDNEFLIFKTKPNEYFIYVGGSSVNFTVPKKEKPSWEHICVSWDSRTGLVTVWLDGQPLPRMGLRKGRTLNPLAFIVLGQEQDAFGGRYDIKQSFVGEISDVYMWTSVLTPHEIGLIMTDSALSDHRINWRSLNYTAKGYVVVEDFLPQIF